MEKLVLEDAEREGTKKKQAQAHEGANKRPTKRKNSKNKRKNFEFRTGLTLLPQAGVAECADRTLILTRELPVATASFVNEPFYRKRHRLDISLNRDSPNKKKPGSRLTNAQSESTYPSLGIMCISPQNRRPAGREPCGKLGTICSSPNCIHYLEVKPRRNGGPPEDLGRLLCPLRLEVHIRSAPSRPPA
ncbi:hypothetical protein AVEN_269398-1 [Araneus ventricosus]|uniref:Uncharacterized protein n=1 Tax=Araneus ventricosus TaxID=182803 RepID=A0A4Y2LYS9_ARAVE|nr:hypothetical protein AVEN_269398-1 [Araneus ventricosus]